MSDIEKNHTPPSAPPASGEHDSSVQDAEILFEWLQSIRSELQSIRKASRLTVMDGMNIAFGFLLMGILVAVVAALFWFVLLQGLLGH